MPHRRCWSFGEDRQSAVISLRLNSFAPAAVCETLADLPLTTSAVMLESNVDQSLGLP